MMLRMLVGFVLAAAIAALAHRLRSLTIGGAVAATFVGGAAVAAGWGWGALLVVYFLASTLLSRTSRAEKEARTASIVEKGGERDAVQVLANGALFAGAALAMHWMPNTRWLALGAGSLAASTADTWATEIGTMVGGAPRSILTGRRVAPGMSGGITMAGTFASLSGAAFLALAALACGWPVAAARVVVIGGIAGSFIDSILGAACQSRRWCAACATETERAVHSCGTATAAHRGLPWIDNDAVNFLSNACGGLLATLLLR
ncbi:MAG TPA: DUF92 domain-containing protein [Gemmatimonadaceae bacterium]|jgi:uncharacterized protein (TIGR00297 family)